MTEIHLSVYNEHNINYCEITIIYSIIFYFLNQILEALNLKIYNTSNEYSPILFEAFIYSLREEIW